MLSQSEARFELAYWWLDCLDGLEMMRASPWPGGVRVQWDFLVDRSTRVLAVLALVDTESGADEDVSEWLGSRGLATIELIRRGAKIVIRGDSEEPSLTPEEGLSLDEDPLERAIGLLGERETEMSGLLDLRGPASVSADCAERLDSIASGMNPLCEDPDGSHPGQADVRARYRAHDDSEFRREESWSDTLADWQSYARRRLPDLIGRGEEGTLPFLAAIASLDSTISGRTVGFLEGVATFLPGGPPLLPEDEGAGP